MKGLYYRRKLALALIETFGGVLSGTKFQKLLFLLNQGEDKKHYDFVPYKYGCFSFQSYDDKGALIAKGLLKRDEKNWVLNKNNANYVATLTTEDQQLLINLKKKFQYESQKDILRHVYTSFPYYAIKSEIAKDILSAKELLSVEHSKPKNTKNVFYTIGYEGKAIEAYINQLLQNDVKLLCDVRKNPLSRKFGFSKNQLNDYLKKFNIEYVHMPELGIDSDKRKNLGETVTHKELFSEYKKTTLSAKKHELSFLIDSLKKYKRIAITCFEADARCCHRSCVAHEIQKIIPTGFSIENI